MTSNEHESFLADLLTAHADYTHTPPPEELVQTVARLGLDTGNLFGHAASDYDHETGVSSWQVTLATGSALIEITAAAARVVEPNRNGEKYPTDWSTLESNSRGPKVYTRAPKVSVRVRQLRNLAELSVIATGSTDSYERPEMVRETWTFTFRDGTDPVVFEIDHSDTERPTVVDDICRHLAAHL